MAVLSKIRQRSVFLIIIIALALFSFVLADVIRNGGMVSQKSRNTIASVNGNDLEREQFARQVEAYQRNMGGNASTSQAVDAVWDLNLRQMLLEEQMDKLGIQVEGAQIRNLLRQQLSGNPTFSNEAGMFDERKLEEYVATMKASSAEGYQQWLDFENSIAKSAQENIYYSLIRAGVGATLMEGEQIYRQGNDKIDMNFVQIPYSSIPDDKIDISKSDIKAYMKKHKARFQTDASRNIRFVHFTEEASAEDEKEVKEDLMGLMDHQVVYNGITKTNDTLLGFSDTKDVVSFVNENSDVNFSNDYVFKKDLSKKYADSLYTLEKRQIFGPYKDAGSWKLSKMIDARNMPDSAKARHILVSYQGAGADVNRTKQEAKELADSIVQVVKKDKTKFATLAAQYSSDDSNKDNAGELNWFSPGMMVSEFNDFVFQNSQRTIGVVETQFGYHVVDIEELTDPEKAVQLATISRKIEPSEKSMNDLFSEVTKFEIATGDKKFEEVAKENDKEVRPVQEIKVLEQNIPGLGEQRKIVQWAFEDGVDVGDIKRFEIRDGYAMVQLTAKNEEGLKSVESASASVLPILQNQKKAEIIKKDLKGNSIEEIAKSKNLSVSSASSINLDNPVLPGAGNEPLVVGAAFGLEVGKVSKPIAGKKGVFVVKTTNKKEAADLDSYYSFSNRATMARRQMVENEVFSALKDAAEIKDNRARFY